MKTPSARGGMTPSQRISNHIAELADWRGDTIARLRTLILTTAPDITEEWKWGTAVWSQNGLVCAAGSFKDHVKLNFFCLLYTSPSPRDLSTSRMPSSA